MKKTRIMKMVSTCMLISAAAAGFGTIASAEDTKTVALVPPAMISPYYASVISGAQEVCDKYGYELKKLAPESESDYASQVQIVEDMITQQVDGIILCAINSDAIVSAVKKANDANIPVVMFNTLNELADGEVACYVNYDQAVAAGDMCDFVAEHFGEDLKVAIIEGLPSDHTTQRKGGFVDRAAEKYPDMEIVASQAGDWEREKGMNAAANMLQANPEIDVIFALSDEMGLGAVRAVKEAGSDAIVVSFDGNPNAVASIQAGDMTATVYVAGPEAGAASVEALHELFEGNEIDKFSQIYTDIIWAENADQFPAEAE